MSEKTTDVLNDEQLEQVAGGTKGKRDEKKRKPRRRPRGKSKRSKKV